MSGHGKARRGRCQTRRDRRFDPHPALFRAPHRILPFLEVELAVGGDQPIARRQDPLDRRDLHLTGTAGERVPDAVHGPQKLGFSCVLVERGANLGNQVGEAALGDEGLGPEELEEWLQKEVLAPVPHRHVVFTMPRLLRGIFRRRRQLLLDLAQWCAQALSAYMRRELGSGTRPGIVVSIATSGDHILVTSRGSTLRTRSAFE